MEIPRRKLERFVGELVGQCFSSQQERANRGAFFMNYFSAGSADQQHAAMYNKIFEGLDDLESLLFSPVSLRFHIGDPDNPNILNEAKGRAAAAKLRSYARKSDTDTTISAAVRLSLIKGKSFIKQQYRRGGFQPSLVQPENMGVMRENHDTLDENMEAFCHRMPITPYQLARLVQNHPDKADIMKRAKKYTRESSGGISDTQQGGMQIVVGGLYPFQPAGVTPSGTRGLVDWLSQPKPNLAPEVAQTLLDLDELWVWDDNREDWTTFQSIGEDILILGKYQLVNATAWDAETQTSNPHLKGQHPFREFCVNPVDDYFWGQSEIARLVGLQEAINARIVGTNRMLRQQEQPSTKFVGSTGVNQLALSRFNKPNGYWTDTNPNAKIERDVITIPQDLWASLHEYERMFDALMGLPPVARGKGESGVRSHNHAETLVRMFSPRFKDRALLVERDVEGLGGFMLDLAKAHDGKKITAWAPKDAAGLEGSTPDPLTIPPAPGLVPVYFYFHDLPEDASLTIDSHSSSPAFMMESEQRIWNMLKAGMMSPATAVEHIDAPDPEELQMEITRREIAQAAAKEKEEQTKLLAKGAKH